MRIQEEQPADRDSIRAVVSAAFGRTGEAELVDALREDGDSVISLVASDAGGLIGHVMFSRMAAKFRALALGPVAVLPERQGAGTGSRLIRAGLDRARREGWQGVFVLGEPAYYARFGFDPALARSFSSRYAGPYLMALALNGPLPALSGPIEYAPAFARVG
jgi:putative acetyltransferase